MRQNSIFEKYNQTLGIWAIIVAALGFFAFFYKDSIKTLFNYWNDYGTYSHGYLTILLSAYLIYVSFRLCKFKYSDPSIISAVLLFVTSLTWLFAYLASINVLQMLSLPFFIYFTFTFFLGLKSYRIFLIPIFILLFTIPIWSLFLPYLQDFAVVTSEMFLSFSNLEFRVVDNTIIFSKGAFEIEESCSGLRYLLVGVLLSIVYGYLNYQSCWSTLLLVLVGVAIMLIGNIIRILIIIWLGVVKGMNYPLVQDHENLGWALFAFLLIPLFVTAKYITPNLCQKTFQPADINEKIEVTTIKVKLLLPLVIYLFTVSIAPLYAAYLKSSISEVASLRLNEMIPVEGWSGPVLFSSRWVPSYSLYSENFTGQFIKDNKTVALSSLLYTKNNPDGELINVNNQLADMSTWKLVDLSPHQVILDRTQVSNMVVNKVTLKSRKENDCIRVWYWFDVNGSAYTKGWQVKLKEAEMLFKGKSGSAITSISIRCNEKSDEVLYDFLIANTVQLKNLIVW